MFDNPSSGMIVGTVAFVGVAYLLLGAIKRRRRRSDNLSRTRDGAGWMSMPMDGDTYKSLERRSEPGTGSRVSGTGVGVSGGGDDGGGGD